MTRCKEFYDKWERDPNWCEKCPKEVDRINNYVRLKEEFTTKGVPEDRLLSLLPATTALPLFSLKDPIQRDQVISAVENALKNNRNLSGQINKPITTVEINKAIRKARNDSNPMVNDPLPNDCFPELLLGDFQEVGKQIPNNSIACIITDPPYGKQYLPLYVALGELAKRVLIPSGFLITYSGQSYLPQVFASLNAHLDYYWTACLLLKNRNLITPQNVYSTWKPISIWYKPPFVSPIAYFNDVINGNGREKDFHDWQQGEDELKTFIELFCAPNGTILDPMAGSGTTLIAAKKFNRKFMGIEENPETFEILKGRLA